MMTLNHIHLAATDVPSTQAFYETYFGFTLQRRHGKGVFLRDSDRFLIALDPTDERVAFPAWFHLGFCQVTEQAVHELHGRMDRDGVNIVRGLLAESGEYASYYVADPDGRWVEVSWHRE